MPRQFFDDFVTVAEEVRSRNSYSGRSSVIGPRMRADRSDGAGGTFTQEAKHFTLLNNRLEAMGSEYGAVRPHATWSLSSWSSGGLGRVEGRPGRRRAVHGA
jgi:hypothetical protein